MLDLDTRQRSPLPTADVKAQQPAPQWALLLAPSTSMCTLGALGVAYAVVLVSYAGVNGKERDLTIFVISALLLAPVCVAIQSFLVRPDFASPRSQPAETVNCWAAVTLLVVLTSLPLAMFVTGKGREFWLQNAEGVVLAIATLHVATLATLRKHSLPMTGALTSRRVQVSVLVVVFFIASLALFRIDPSNRHLNVFVGLFLAPPFSGEPGAFPLGQALMLAVFAIAAVVGLGRLEAALIRRGPKQLQAARTIACFVSVLAIVMAFFDFSLANDVAHYLTNVGPALHLLHRGTLMVDTFSQYGPGPVLITLLGLQIGPATFGTAQVTVQICNFAFYGVWLICLYRMTRWKLAGLLLGIFSIAFFLAAYIRGYGNINDAPSVLAFRYLPTLLMVLALSCLRPPQRHSVFTAIATFISGIWSVETLIGTLGVHLAFLVLLRLRDRMLIRLAVDGMRAAVPAVVAIIAVTVAIVLRAGAWPDYGTYLQYFSAYNPLAAFWSFVASPMFFGWLAMLFAVFVVGADVWTRVFNRTARLTDLDETTLFYRFVPMAVLLMIQAAYFVGRAIDSSLGLAVLPFCAIAIPAAIAITATLLMARGSARLLALIPLAIGLWALTFTFLSLFRHDSPYSLLLHECRDLGRCSPAAIARGLNETIHIRPVLERVRRPITDGWFDNNGIVRDAVSMMTKWARDEPAVTVLLGRLRPELDVTATELALMYAGKWDRWPRSYTMSDQLVIPLAQRIIAAPVRLREGELVLVRRDESALPFIEAGILKRIRAEATLCQLPDPSREVAAYRVVAGSFGCPPG